MKLQSLQSISSAIGHPFLVATNQERIQISYHQAKKFAIKNNTYIYKWPVNIYKWQNRPKIQNHQKLVERHAVFWQFFVPGADAYLTYNLNSSLGLANGTPVTLHSSSFSSDVIYNEINEKFHNLPAGSEITLTDQYIPISVNVQIHVPDTLSCYKQKTFAKLKEFSLDPHDIVIPLLPNAGTDSTKYKLTVPGCHPMYK